MICSRPPARGTLALALLLGSIGCSESGPVAPEAGPGPALNARAAAAQPAAAYVILLKDGVTADLSTVVRGLGGSVGRYHREVGVITATGLSTDAIAQLRQRSEVADVGRAPRFQFILPQGLRRASQRLASRLVTPRSDQSGAAFLALQWNLRVIHADEAWLATNQGAGVRVAILDSGIDPRHIDMFGTVDPSCSASFIEGESELIDRSGHGTLVASIVRSNGFGVASVAPDAILCSVKIGTVEGLPLDAIFAGIIYSATLGVDVINMSFGGYADTKSPDDRAFIQAFQRVIDFAARRGALLVASAGNQAINTNDLPPNIVDFPASLEHVIGVGATGPVGQQDFDRIASYSNVGRDGVDVFAPGGDSAPNGSELDLILGPCSASIELFDCSDGLSYVVGDGTSFAAPHVAGEAAVIESQIAGDQDGGFLTSCILKSADAVTGRKIDPLYDHGRINVLRGAQCAPASGIGVNLNAK